MPDVRATDFVRHFSRYSNDPFGEIVRVTKHGVVVGAYLSLRDLAHFEHLKRQESLFLMISSAIDEIVPGLAQNHSDDSSGNLKK